MDSINTSYLKKCLAILEKSYELLLVSPKDSIEYEIYRNSTIKAFEMTLEQSGTLLRKKLKPFFANPKDVDRLTYKDLFRYSLKHALLTQEAVSRWFAYRDNRNNTAHNYGIHFAEETLILLADFIQDVKDLELTLKND